MNGLPGGTNAAVTLTGPQTVNITGSTTLSVLAVGSYTLTASNVNANVVPLAAAQADAERLEWLLLQHLLEHFDVHPQVQDARSEALRRPG